jgi:integrase
MSRKPSAAQSRQTVPRVLMADKKEIGLTINMHLFRHIAAQIWLHSHPGQHEVVKRLLGHSALSQTLNVYAGFEAGTSARLFAEVIEAARRK